MVTMRASRFGGAIVLATLAVAGCNTGPRWSTNSPEAVRAYEEGVSHWNRFYYVEAAASFQKAIAADSTFAAAWARLAFVHANASDEAEARKESRRAMALCANAPLREQLLVRLLFYRIMYANIDAAAVADSMIALYPDDAEAFYVRGQLYEQGKNLEAAVKMYGQAVKVDTGFGLGFMSLGYAYSELGEQDKAVAFMQRYIRVAQGTADPRASYADILLPRRAL